tara:strand:+ start:1853 stop:2020 length:168 start_codon:yes stop_codon:yes gene_type:complete
LEDKFTRGSCNGGKGNRVFCFFLEALIKELGRGRMHLNKTPTPLPEKAHWNLLDP